MPFQKIEPERVANSITRQIESLILKGVLRPGERLPPERELAATLGVSRPSLREALSGLESRDLVETRAGAGVFVAQVLGSAFSPALVELFSTHEEAFFDYLSFRRDLEGLAAERAAVHAGETDLQVIQDIFERMEAVHPKRRSNEEAKLDAEFHMAIVEAAHNVVMMHMMRSMFEMLQAGVFYNRQLLFGKRSIRCALLEQHRAILTAILARDPVAARKAVEDHLSFIEEAMKQQIRDADYEETAKLRIARQKALKK